MPLFIGEGQRDLVCRCGESVLVRGYQPERLLGLDLQCFRCGAVTRTPTLADGAAPPAEAHVARRASIPVATPLPLPPGAALVGEEEAARLDALIRPADAPRVPTVADASGLAEVKADYERLTGGKLDAHQAALQAGAMGSQAAFPLAWALAHLARRVDVPDWTRTPTPEDTTAVAQLAAFRHFLACWSRHPLFERFVAGAAADGFSLHDLAVFGAAKCLSDAGNRVVFEGAGTGRVDSFRLLLAPPEYMTVLVRRFDRYEWPRETMLDVAPIRGAVIEALEAAQSRINPRHPGILVLSAGSVRYEFDQKLVDAIQLALRTEGRRHRGVAAIAAILPKILPADRPDAVNFAWSFYPIANQRHTAATVRIGSRDDFVAPRQ